MGEASVSSIDSRFGTAGMNRIVTLARLLRTFKSTVRVPEQSLIYAPL